MKSLVQGFLTGTRAQALALTPRQVISPRFPRHLNTLREISPLWGRITHLSVQVPSDTSIPHELPFAGMRDGYPGPALWPWRALLAASLPPFAGVGPVVSAVPAYHDRDAVAVAAADGAGVRVVGESDA